LATEFNLTQATDILLLDSAVFVACDNNLDGLCSFDEWDNYVEMLVEFNSYRGVSTTIAIADLSSAFSTNEISAMDRDSDSAVNSTEWFKYKSLKQTFMRISEGADTFTFAQGL
jgi:hypothetical protein